MKKLLVSSLVAILVFISPFSVVNAASNKHANPEFTIPKDLGALDGVWEGTLAMIKGPELADIASATLPVRIVIKDKTVHVFIGDGFKREVKPDQFKIEQLATNAVIFSNSIGPDNEGVWVESWSFLVTQKDKDTLITIYSRVVNNLNLSLTSDHSKFAKVGTAEFRRVLQ